MSSPRPAARRKPPEERRAEIVETASRLAVAEGLESVTARRVADALGVYPGLVNHYFNSADELVATAFAHAASAERDLVFGHAEEAATPTERMRRLLAAWLAPERDAVSLLWLDAWQASRRRAAVLAAVTAQMNLDLDRLERIIRAGVDGGAFRVADPRATAARVLALIDGVSVQAAVRTTLDYEPVREMVLAGTSHELGLPPGSLAPP
jgi:AcrR family transcriptional regulator